MYAIHTTSGFIIGSRPSGEAGKFISIFTRDLGLVFATAQGIRFERSKLRPFTQDYSFGQFSFVRGKEFWRLVNAQENEARFKIQDSRISADSKLIPRIASLLERLLHGEESHAELFDCVQSIVQCITDSPELNNEEMVTLESLAVIRILNHLGYIGNDPILKMCFQSNAITSELLADVKGKRTDINRHINKALRESHL